MSKTKPRFSKPAAFFWMFRLNRTVMVGTFFFAMFGGRGMIDIRDFP
jgi:hypothetical protein